MKETKDRKSRKARHDPLEKQLHDFAHGKVKAPKKQGKSKGGQDGEEGEPTDVSLSPAISRKILMQAREQQHEEEAKTKTKTSGLLGHARVSRYDSDLSDEGEGFSDDEEEYDIEEIEIDEDDERALAMFMSEDAQSRTLADIIMQKIAEKEEGAHQYQEADSMFDKVASGFDKKVVEVYSGVGKYMKKFKSGKLPKAFKILPSLRNWEDILFLTAPEEWSPQ